MRLYSICVSRGLAIGKYSISLIRWVNVYALVSYEYMWIAQLLFEHWPTRRNLDRLILERAVIVLFCF